MILESAVETVCPFEPCKEVVFWVGMKEYVFGNNDNNNNIGFSYLSDLTHLSVCLD